MAENLSQLQDLLNPGTKHASYSEYLPDLFVDSVSCFIDQILAKFSDVDPAQISAEDIRNFVEGSAEYQFLLPILKQ